MRLLPETVGNIVVVVVYSQQTQTPASVHQPVRREATGQTHLRAEGRPAVRRGRRLHGRHRYVRQHSRDFLCQGPSKQRFIRAFVFTVTEYANHARDHLRTEAELKKFDG